MSASWNAVEPSPARPLAWGDRLRFGARAAALVALTLGSFAIFLVLRGIDLLGKPLGPRRPPALAPWVVHAWGRLALPLTGLRYRQVGRPMALPGAFVANHASWLDIVVLMRACRVFFVSKDEVQHWPGIGAIARAIGTMFIERRATEARRQRDVLFTRLTRGDRMAIFPEGTSTDGLRVIRFKSTLFDVFFAPELRETVWIQPVSLVYRPPDGLPPDFYGWWGDMDFVASARSILAFSRGGEVVAIFHEPLRVADFSGRKALAEASERAARAGLEAHLSVPAAAE